MSQDQMDEMLLQRVMFRDIDKAMNSSAFLKITPRVILLSNLPKRCSLSIQERPIQILG